MILSGEGKFRVPLMEGLARCCLGLLLALPLTACNIRYISPDDIIQVPEESAQADGQGEVESTPSHHAAERAGGDRPWYQRLFPGAEDAGSTEPVHPIGESDPARTITPPQATAAPHVETADQVHARLHPTDPDDPLRSAEHRWVMERGITLEEGLRSWAEQVGLHLRWDVPRIYKIEAPIIINGTFEYAFSRVMEAYALADRPVLFDYGLYANQVLRVTLRGEMSP